VESAPGAIKLFPIQPFAAAQGLATHHLDAPKLLALGRDLYASVPQNAR
jgi:hypothetical protein